MDHGSAAAQGLLSATVTSATNELATPCPYLLGQYGLSFNNMALITSDCGTMCHSSIKWP